MPRQDLLELTPEALTALANAGFVKRAQKDVAAGLLPRLEEAADGTVTAHFDDGVLTRLAPGRTLRDAACSCPASSMCRHRVMLVLAYQAQVGDFAPPSAEDAPAEPAAPAGWSPAQFDDAALAASFAPSVLEQALRLAAARPVIAVQAGQGADGAPVARLPMCSVRFFSRSSLVHARCDCSQGSGCAHVVLAVWAFREAGALPRADGGGGERMVALAPRSAEGQAAAHDAAPRWLAGEPAQAARAQLDALLLALWLDGSGQALLALTARVEALRAQVQALGWRWVDDGIDELWMLLQAQHARSSRFDARRLLAVTAELWARLQAAAHVESPPAESTSPPPLHGSQILGLGVKGEVALDHLRLVSLGAVLWSDDDGEGADVLLADPDTQTVMVLERNWPRTADAAAGGTPATLASRRVAGFPLRQVAAGQVLTKTASRRANGRIEITAGARQTGVMPLSPSAWDELRAPLRQASVRGLIAQLQARLPEFVLPRQAASGAAAGSAGALHVLACDEGLQVQGSHWDAAAQVLHGQLHCGGDEAAQDPPLWLALSHRAAAPGAVDALARALGGEWGALRAVAGTVRLEDGQARMAPLALLTTQRAVVLQVEPPLPQALALQAGPAPRSARSGLVQDTQALLGQWLRQGLRHQGGGMAARAQAQATVLREAGLGRCAALLEAVPQQLRSADRSALLPRLSTLGLLLDGVAQ
ncbi:SWIM zinc finger family protein [Xenophilus arseniciresistens]|uniref:SWIM zinc finger family protein n=1 Tax=Xenophilus arseniciresistens TaxID=1283306 RepID=A0AAE3N817_9BURK|nr:SWIM zinc finger family protein [Xenophilus arseniciresistens]MDA7416244.1 SWIM zinc finger family protein [Xenophilus arseniciresistens]